MTKLEREEYNKLSAEEKELYNFTKKRHPNWSHKQIMTKVALDHSLIDIMDKGGEDVNPNDPDVLTQILQGAKEFLKNAGIFIAEIFQTIDKALTYLGELIRDGIDFVEEKIDKFWDWVLG